MKRQPSLVLCAWLTLSLGGCQDKGAGNRTAPALQERPATIPDQAAAALYEGALSPKALESTKSDTAAKILEDFNSTLDSPAAEATPEVCTNCAFKVVALTGSSYNWKLWSGDKVQWLRSYITSGNVLNEPVFSKVLNGVIQFDEVDANSPADIIAPYLAKADLFVFGWVPDSEVSDELIKKVLTHVVERQAGLLVFADDTSHDKVVEKIFSSGVTDNGAPTHTRRNASEPLHLELMPCDQPLRSCYNMAYIPASLVRSTTTIQLIDGYTATRRPGKIVGIAEGSDKVEADGCPGTTYKAAPFDGAARVVAWDLGEFTGPMVAPIDTAAKGLATPMGDANAVTLDPIETTTPPPASGPVVLVADIDMISSPLVGSPPSLTGNGHFAVALLSFFGNRSAAACRPTSKYASNCLIPTSTPTSSPTATIPPTLTPVPTSTATATLIPTSTPPPTLTPVKPPTSTPVRTSTTIKAPTSTPRQTPVPTNKFPTATQTPMSSVTPGKPTSTPQPRVTMPPIETACIVYGILPEGSPKDCGGVK